MLSGSFCRRRRLGQAIGSMSWLRPWPANRAACWRKFTKPSLYPQDRLQAEPARALNLAQGHGLDPVEDHVGATGLLIAGVNWPPISSC
jgi:hypothetical protein